MTRHAPLFCHGIVPAGTPPVLGVPAHERVAAGNLAALVSPFRPLDTEAECISCALMHDAILAGYLAVGPVLPIRFGTCFSGPDAVMGQLEAHDTPMLGQLSALNGLAEYGLTVDNSGHEPSADRGASGLHSGRAYLEARRHQRDARQIRRAVHARALEQLSRLAAGLSHSQVPGPAKENGLRCMSLSLLLDREAARKLSQALPAWQADVLGLQARLCGPWPPYSFCSQISGTEMEKQHG